VDRDRQETRQDFPNQKGREVMIAQPLLQFIDRQAKLVVFRKKFLKQQREYQAKLLRGPILYRQKHGGGGWNAHTQCRKG